MAKANNKKDTPKSRFYKHPTYGFVYGEMMRTPIARCAWPSLVKPKPAMKVEGKEPGQPRFELTILLPKMEQETKDFLVKLNAMVKDMLPLFNEGKQTKIAIEDVLKDGNSFDAEKYPYYQENWVLTARNVAVTAIIGPKQEPVTADRVQGGMKVRLMITPLITAHGVSFKLEGTQLVKDDGTKFGGSRPEATSFFDAISDEEEGDSAEETSDEEPKNGKDLAVNLL